MEDPVSPVPAGESSDPGQQALRKIQRRFLIGVGVLIALYYNVYLIPMIGHTLIPFFALGGIAFLVGCALPKKPAAVSWSLFALVAVATVFRRIEMLNVPITEELFGGALAQGGYAPWAGWLAELLRLRVYLAALRLGSRTGAGLRNLPDQTAA